MDLFGQAPFPCRFFWGPEGAALAGDRGDIVVVVDVFSFSSAVAVLASRGAEVLPAQSAEDARTLAGVVPAAVVLPGRRHATPEGWSHSPISLQVVPPGTRLIFFSSNGGRCCSLARGAASLVVGGLINASAVVAATVERHWRLGAAVSVVACGERWVGSDTLRPCLEDELGAGAIISALGLARSPEADSAARLYDSLRGAVASSLWECASGRELRARGFLDDVRYMSHVDAIAVAAVRDADGWLRGHSPGPG